MRKERVISSYYKLTDSALATLAGKVVGALDNNANFLNLTPPFTILQGLSDDYRAKYSVASRGGSVLEVSLKNESRKALLDALRILAHHVNGVANGNLVMLIGSGLILAKQPTKIEIPEISERVILRDSHLKGQLRLDFTLVKNAWEYEIAVGGLDENGIINWENEYQSTASQGIVLAPLVSGSEVFVRVRARNGKGTGDWSESTSLIVK